MTSQTYQDPLPQPTSSPKRGLPGCRFETGSIDRVAAFIVFREPRRGREETVFLGLQMPPLCEPRNMAEPSLAWIRELYLPSTLGRARRSCVKPWGSISASEAPGKKIRLSENNF